MKLPTYDSLLLDIEQHVATITLNRPDKRNAFNDDVIQELTDVFQFCAEQDEVRVVVLTANGKAFCAGADLNWMRAMADYSHDENLADAVQNPPSLPFKAMCMPVVWGLWRLVISPLA